MSESEPDRYDAIVIGSGFAGAVTACRLAGAGMKICILERGRRFDAKQDFPVYPTPADANVPSDAPEDGRDTVQPDVTRMFWKLGNGVWDFRDLGDLLVGQAAGYGGGSLIYANVHLRPPAHVFDERWRVPGTANKDQPYYQRGKLEPYFDLVAQTLDVAPLPDDHNDLPKRVQLGRAAHGLNRLQKERPGIDQSVEEPYLRRFSTPLAVNFHAKEGADGARGVCDLKGNCCLGCPEGAKNTLDFNYLEQAERPPRPAGDSMSSRQDFGVPAEVRTLAEVLRIQEPEAEGGLFEVEYVNHNAARARVSLRSKYVFVCAGAVNTTELLMRCKEAGTLTFDGNGLGTRFHPNQDALSAVFDCDEPHEMDRGPTITSSLLYDLDPKESNSSTRWRLAFEGASIEPALGSEISCGSGGTAEVVSPPYLVSGSYKKENAIGELTVVDLRGDFEKGQKLLIDGKEWGRVEAVPHEIRHWFLVQDGGFPVDFEPAFGVFRSLLWLGRNAFREEQRRPSDEHWPRERNDRDPDRHDHIEHAGASQRIGFATLPIEALVSLLTGITRGSFALPEPSELGVQLLNRSSGASAGPSRRWPLVPAQLDGAVSKFRERALDSVGLATEGIVSSFLEDAAGSLSEELYSALASLSGIEPEQLERIKKLNLTSSAFRLGAQLLWGSQSGLARGIAEQLFETSFSGRGKLVEAGVDLLRHTLDYRLGNGRTAMLLSFGLDSVPGRLVLDLPPPLKIGTELRGAVSGARAYFVHTKQSGNRSSSKKNRNRTFVVTGGSGEFKEDEYLFDGRTKVGKFQSEEALEDGALAKRRGVSAALQGLPLRALEVELPRPSAASAPAATASLRAQLPEAIDTPERGVQERVLRDIASAWDGELRTDPLWSVAARRLTVHSGGGCPMGPPDRAVTDWTGEVHGCRGLFVMDSAAFPGPVGANPSATIAAIAEYKVAEFLKSQSKEHSRAVDALRQKRRAAKEWVDLRGRKEIDPLNEMPEKYSVEPLHRPIGIEFTEKMAGSVQGPGGSRPVEMTLTVGIDDLAEFLELHARDSSEPVRVVSGTLEIDGEKRAIHPDRSRMIVMERIGTDPEGQEVRLLKYHLCTRDGAWELDGKKEIYDDPGFDAWDDTTTLELTLKEGGAEWKGEVLLSASDFFTMQLPSFKADTDDPARQAWAMASFGKFFFGNLAAVYLPGLDRMGELATGFWRRGHG